MRVSINSPIASLVTNLTEEQLFSLFDVALNYAGKKTEVKVPAIPPLATGGIIENPEVVVPFGDKTKEFVKAVEESVSGGLPATVHLNGVPLAPTKTAFKGFLYLQCEECGKFKGFMPKNPISEYRCDCGHTTPLKDMRVMYVSCKCGQKFKYLTNTTEDVVTMDCMNCGSPIDLEWHSKNHNYST